MVGVRELNDLQKAEINEADFLRAVGKADTLYGYKFADQRPAKKECVCVCVCVAGGKRVRRKKYSGFSTR